MEKGKKILNELLVQLFNDILQIEEKSLKNGPLSDLSVTELHTIEAIGMYKERTMTEVAQDLKITVGTLTTAINKLIKKGYVDRKRIEEDRRVFLLHPLLIHLLFHLSCHCETFHVFYKEKYELID